MESRNPNLRMFGIDFGRQRNRRLAVLALYGAYPFAVGMFAQGPTHPAWYGAGLAPMAVVAMTFWVLNQFSVPYAEASGAAPDERQVEVRNRSFFRAYQFLAGITSFWLLYQSLGISVQRKLPQLWLPQTYSEHSVVFWTFLILALTVPNAILAWAEPDTEG
jgi:hypothetical protein